MILWLLLILFIPGGFGWIPDPDYTSVDNIGTAAVLMPICEGSAVRVYYETPLEIQNQYTLYIQILAETKTLILKFDSEVRLEMHVRMSFCAVCYIYNPTHCKRMKKIKITETKNNNVEKLARPRNSYRFTFDGDEDFELELQVFGPASGTVPYVESVLRDYYEICRNPEIGFLDRYIEREVENRFSVDDSCGRRKVTHTQLIVHGQSTEPGDWPWHVAILRLEKSSFKYICGGTLLTKTLVLTAAHCASIRGNAVIPEILSVYLGKHHLTGGDIGTQEREVFRVTIHPNFDGFTLDNDIALLKLKTEAVITDYVQPACLWYKEATNKLPDSQSIFGTVAGWGFNHTNSLSPTLQKITIPIVPELTCYKSNPTFFHHRLNDNKFCAGFVNGTSVCNGDSGGGLMIFVPDSFGDTDMASGGWYVRGIVSVALRRTDAFICDPYQYTIFTDVEKYQDWVLEYMK